MEAVSEDVSDSQSVYAPTCPTPAMDARIHITIGGAAALEMDVLRSLPISALKVGIEKATGVKAVNQMLTFNGEELRDQFPVWAFHIETGDSIILDAPISIHINGRTLMALDLLRSAKITYIKQAVEKATATSVERQQLSYRGEFCGNDTMLWDYGIVNGAVLDLDELVRIRIVGIVKFAAMFVEIWTSSTVTALKKLIKEETGIPIANQRLYKNNRSLENMDTLRELGIFDGDVLNLERNILMPEAEKVKVVYYVDTPL